MTYAEIRAALEVHLSTMPGVPEIDYENVNFTPTTGTPYIKCRVVDTARRRMTTGLNPEFRQQGYLNLQLYYPLGEGSGNSSNMVTALLNRFDPPNSVPNSKISLDYAEKANSFEESNWYITIVNVGWYVHTT